MVNIADKAKAKDLGLKGYDTYIYIACPDCGKLRWVVLSAKDRYCRTCIPRHRKVLANRGNPNGISGVKVINGYHFVTIPPDSPFIGMAKRYSGKKAFRVAEHRLIMARHIGRLLEPWEIVHHINGIKDDNRIENLELLPNKANHLPYTILQDEIKALKAKMVLLEADIVRLEQCVSSDSIPEAIQRLRCYNTLGSLFDGQTEGIVRSPSNRGL